MATTRSAKAAAAFGSPASTMQQTQHKRRSSRHKGAAVKAEEVAMTSDESDAAVTSSSDFSSSTQQQRRKRARPMTIEPTNAAVLLDCEERIESACNDSKTEAEQKRSTLPAGVVDIEVLAAKRPDYDATYAKDIHKTKIQHEERAVLHHRYFDSFNVQITERMRAILVDWLAEVAEEHRFLPDTLHVSVALVDLYLATVVVPRAELQLLGAACLFVASKLGEVNTPTIEWLVEVSDRSYTGKQLLNMEASIATKLRFDLYLPTRAYFLEHFMFICQANAKQRHLASYLCDLTLQEFLFSFYKPSQIAAAIVHYVRQSMVSLHVSPWNANLEFHTGYQEHELRELTVLLQRLHEITLTSPLRTIKKKYDSSVFCHAARIPVMREADMRFGNIEIVP